MKKILCVVDFAESTGKVLEVATRIAKAYDAHLIVLFPYRLIDYGYRGDIPSLKTKLEREAKEKFFDLKNKIPAMQEVSCEFQAEIGFISDRVSAHVRRNDLDMVIIGQQQNNLGTDSKGYNLHELISSSKLPFVVVPSEVRSKPITFPVQ